jgi:hypothetical protein
MYRTREYMIINYGIKIIIYGIRIINNGIRDKS